MNFAHRGILVASAVVAFRTSILGYSPLGHDIVGAIADERLANTPTAAKVNALLDGLKLEKAALIADEIQSGLGRTGRAFAYQRHTGLPDVVVVAKSLRDLKRSKTDNLLERRYEKFRNLGVVLESSRRLSMKSAG